MGERNTDYSNMTLEEFYISRGLENASVKEKIDVLRSLGLEHLTRKEASAEHPFTFPIEGYSSESLQVYELGARYYYFKDKINTEEPDDDSFRRDS